MSLRTASVPGAAVRALRRAATLACLLGLAVALGGCRRDDDEDTPPPRAVQFHAAEMVTAAPVLTGDPTDGGCSDGKCVSNNNDVLGGQRRLLRIEDIGLGARTHNSGSGSDFFVGGIVTTAGSGVKAVRASALSGQLDAGTGSAPAVIGARLFNADRDVLVSALTKPGALSVVIDFDDSAHTRMTGIAGDGLAPGNSLAPRLMAATADFDGDGTEEVVFATYGSTSRLQVMYATDVNATSKGVTFGSSLGVDPMLAVATGNFLGTGPMVVTAVAQPDGSLVLQYFAVDPASRRLGLQRSLKLDRPAGALAASDVSIAVGRYNAAAFARIVHDQMLIGVADAGRVDLLSVDAGYEPASGSLAPVQRQRAVSSRQPLMRTVLRAARFDWSSPFDTVAYLLTNKANTGGASDLNLQSRLFTVLTLDVNLDVAKQTPNVALIADQCLYDMQVGNFDRRRPDPTPNAPPNATLHDPDLQLVFLVSTATNYTTNSDGLPIGDTCSGGDSGDASRGMNLAFWNVTPGSDGTLSVASADTNYTWSSFTQARIADAALAVPDLQARSLVLGSPKLLVQPSNRQVSLVLAAPPMHADFIGADGALVNLSVAPAGFSAAFDFSSSSDHRSTTTETNSSTFATEQTIDLKLTYGVCGATGTACGSLENKTALKESSDSSNAAMSATFGTTFTELEVGAVFQDQVVWTDEVLTFYVYPVLGKYQCPATKPACADDEKVQLTVVFAGPDTVVPALSDGGSMNWYQPPWMPGNVLSYPGNRDQLQKAAFPQDNGTIHLLSPPGVSWSTGEGRGSQSVTWADGAASGSTVSHSGSFSYNNTTSIGLNITPPLGLGTNSSVSVSESGSSAWANLTDSKKTLSQSTGVTFTKGAQFARPSTYQYAVTPVIFGQLTPPTAVDVPALTAGVNTWGALRTGYMVNPSGDTAGTVWNPSSGAYASVPDVAFNHPNRWTHKATAADAGDGSCLFVPSAEIYECVSLTKPTPRDPISDEYHKMRGFFVTGAESGGQGSQLAAATAGDKLLLQARVHNFSLGEMPEGTKVHVRFYGIRLDASTQLPETATRSFLIGEAVIDRIPAFNTNTPNPNWALASQSFDTSDYAGAHLLFWAVTWMADGSGRMVAELPGKGLKDIPSGGAAAPDYADVVSLDQPHGNNIGIYHEVFQILPKPAAAAAASPPRQATAPSVAIAEVGSDVGSVQNGDRVLLSARLRIGENTLSGGLAVHFIDGVPGSGGTLIAAPKLQRLVAGRTYEFHASFRPRQCGRHPIHVVAGPGTRFEHVAKLGEIEVTCL